MRLLSSSILFSMVACSAGSGPDGGEATGGGSEASGGGAATGGGAASTGGGSSSAGGGAAGGTAGGSAMGGGSTATGGGSAGGFVDAGSSAPVVLSATAPNNRTVNVQLSQPILISSVSDAGTQFTIPGLVVNAASVLNDVVKLKTATQAAGITYAVTVAATVLDAQSRPVGMPNVATFTGAAPNGVRFPDAGTVLNPMVDANHPPNDGVCRLARVVGYPGDGTTCGFQRGGPAMLPQLLRDGYHIAPNEAFYNLTWLDGGFDTGHAPACGECLELTGPRGTLVGMVNEICDAAASAACGEPVVTFAVNTARLGEIAYTNGYSAVSYRWVPCPGNDKPGLIIKNYPPPILNNIEVTPYNERVPVRKVELRGPAYDAGVWATGAPLWVGRYNFYVSNGVTNPGFPAEFRLTSEQGETLTFPPLPAFTQIPTDMTIGLHVATTQFSNQRDTDVGTCAWVGVPPVVYDDQFPGLPRLQWRNFSAFGLTPGTANFAYATSCHSGSACINLGTMGSFSAQMFAATSRFPLASFKSLELWARTSGEASKQLQFQLDGFDATDTAAVMSTAASFTITPTWQKFVFDLAPLAGTLVKVNTFRVANNTGIATTSDVVLDDIRFVAP